MPWYFLLTALLSFFRRTMSPSSQSNSATPTTKDKGIWLNCSLAHKFYRLTHTLPPLLSQATTTWRTSMCFRSCIQLFYLTMILEATSTEWIDQQFQWRILHKQLSLHLHLTLQTITHVVNSSPQTQVHRDLRSSLTGVRLGIRQCWYKRLRNLDQDKEQQHFLPVRLRLSEKQRVIVVYSARTSRNNRCTSQAMFLAWAVEKSISSTYSPTKRWHL